MSDRRAVTLFTAAVFTLICGGPLSLADAQPPPSRDSAPSAPDSAPSDPGSAPSDPGSGLPSSDSAQSANPDSSASKVPPSDASSVGPSRTGGRPPGIRALSVGVPAGPGRYVARKWGMVKADIVNSTDHDANVLVSSYLGDDKSLQFGRRIWVPAHSRRLSWYPIRVPPVDDRRQDRISIGSLVREVTSDPTRRETIADKPNGKLILDQGRVVTGLLAGLQESANETDWSYEAVLATRTCQQQSRQLAILEPRMLPATPESIEALDQLVVAYDKLNRDPAAVRSIRTWVFRGGRLWIMLDKAGAESAADLLGDASELTVIDRVGLTTVTVESVDPVPGEKPESTDFEEPVELVRVLVPSEQVTHTVNGWPAAFWVTVGRGRVLVTTLGPRGWIRIRRSDDPPPRSDLHLTDYYPRAPLQQLAGEFLVPESNDVLPTKQSEPGSADAVDLYLFKRIGYKTLPRPVLVGILGGFCLVVVVGAVWFSQRGKPERLAPTTAVAAVVVTSVIVGLGWSTRRTVPPTVADFQLVEVLSDPTRIHVGGRLGLYNPTALDEPLGVDRGGILWPDMTGLSGKTRRMMFTDLDRYRWENLRLPPGVRLAELQMAVSAGGTLRALGRFDQLGVVGTLDAPGLEDPADALLATPSGRMIAVRLGQDGTFSAPANAVLDQGQFMADGLLSDEQQRRRAVYAQLLKFSEITRLVHRPTLFVWASSPDLPLRLPPDSQRLGAALFAIPLRLQPSPPGSPLRIPSPLIPMRSVVGPRGQALSSSYNNRKREWLKQSSPAELHLRFRVPSAALPLDLELATLRLKLNCPTRKVEVVGFDKKEPVVLATYDGPARIVTLPIRDPRVLRLDHNGGLLLGVYIDRGESAENDADWQIEDAQLEVSGRAGP